MIERGYYPIAMGILSILFTWTAMLVVFGLTILPWFWLRPSRAKIRVLLVMIIGPAIAGFVAGLPMALPPSGMALFRTELDNRAVPGAHPGSLLRFRKSITSWAMKSLTHSTAAQHSTAQHSTAQHSAAQHSTARTLFLGDVVSVIAQHSTAQHSTAQHSAYALPG